MKKIILLAMIMVASVSYGFYQAQNDILQSEIQQPGWNSSMINNLDIENTEQEQAVKLIIVLLIIIISGAGLMIYLSRILQKMDFPGFSSRGDNK